MAIIAFDGVLPDSSVTTGRRGVAQQSSPEAGILDLIDDSEDCPDGGREAWTVVFGAWCAMIPSMGLLNTVGVLQAWVWTHQLRDYTEFDIGWIFGLYAFFLYVTGAQVGE
jgi:hypothetical protein